MKPAQPLNAQAILDEIAAEEAQFLKIRNEVRSAYIDCIPPVCTRDGIHRFRASASVSKAEAIAILKEVCPAYNGFYVRNLKYLPDNAQITIAREYSMCLYVKGKMDELRYKAKLRADEIDQKSDLLLGDEVRIWWD